MTVKIYAERDLMALDKAGDHYCRHVDHMTKESLHSKSDIAAELGWRDMQIAELQRKVEALAAESVFIFNAGYHRGHESTVEGNYVHIYQSDMSTHHEDIVAEIIEEQATETSSAMAEIRAQGVDMAIERLTKKFEGTGGVGVPVMTLEHLASELRKKAGL